MEVASFSPGSGVLTRADTPVLACTGVFTVVIPVFTCGRYIERVGEGERERFDSRLGEEYRGGSVEEAEILCRDMAGSECAYGRPAKPEFGWRYSGLALDNGTLKAERVSETLDEIGLSGRIEIVGGAGT